MTEIDTRLDRLGEALRASARQDLAASERTAVARHPRLGRRRRIRLAAALAVLVVAIPAAAFATGVLSPDQEVAHGVAGLEWMMAGTEPTCTALREGVEYDCTLAKPPQEEAPISPSESVGDVHGRAGEWKGYVIGIVNKTGHVSGGCRAESADGTRWRCYLGQESIRQGSLEPSALGQYLPEAVK
ncbi:MAG: hypothetical protein QM729_07930 [Solirubrobacterales bacterium]